MGWPSSSETVTITLVRHGQASYLEGDNYDRLSPIGERQSRLLGEYWAARGATFDACFSGPVERHLSTAAIVADIMLGAERRWPETAVLPEFDEFPGEEIMREFTPILIERHAEIRRLAGEFQAVTTKSERKRVLDVLFPAVAERWVSGEVSSAEIESWGEFAARVARGIDLVRKRLGPGSSAVVFTSAGPTAVAASLALDTTPRKTFELTFSPRNASLTELFCNGRQVALGAFNTHPHLDEPDLLTYR